jgi:hypothetical protein
MQTCANCYWSRLLLNLYLCKKDDVKKLAMDTCPKWLEKRDDSDDTSFNYGI